MHFGSILEEEAKCLGGLVSMLNPMTVVEFGFAGGESSRDFLNYMGKDSKIYSFDIESNSLNISRGIKDNRFKFIHKSQTDFLHSDIDNRVIDFCFLDASHNCDLNIQTFNKIKEHMSRDAILVTHDTGGWRRKFSLKDGRENYWIREVAPFDPGYYITEDEYGPQIGEREFVNYITEGDSGFVVINLHTPHAFRHGLTMFQKERSLEIERWKP